MNPVDLIIKKRNGGMLSPDEIDFLIRQYVQDSIPDYQLAAFLMAVYFNGMNHQETVTLLKSFLNSGKTIPLNDITGKKVDKHSTGGVGDKTSILLAPIVAAAGVPVPMISGRGLGHTGGTLDKLSAIPGFRTDLDIKTFRHLLATIGVCLNGQTPELVPADRKIYSLRDVTGTIESFPFIAASILSKKLAEGSDALVLDIKFGDGAFMPSQQRAEELAQLLIGTGEESGLTTVAYLSNMDQPLGYCVGNWLEILECIRCLHGEDVPDLLKLTFQLAGTMIFLGEKAASIDEGIEIARHTIADGSAWNKFCEIVHAQSGDLKIIENPDSYPTAKFIRDVISPESGHIHRISAREIGLCAIELGAGRKKIHDTIDPKAGIVCHHKVGARINSGDRLFTLFTDREDQLEPVQQRIMKATVIRDAAIEAPTLIGKYLDRARRIV